MESYALLISAIAGIGSFFSGMLLYFIKRGITHNDNSQQFLLEELSNSIKELTTEIRTLGDKIYVHDTEIAVIKRDFHHISQNFKAWGKHGTTI